MKYYFVAGEPIVSSKKGKVDIFSLTFSEAMEANLIAVHDNEKGRTYVIKDRFANTPAVALTRKDLDVLITEAIFSDGMGLRYETLLDDIFEPVERRHSENSELSNPEDGK